ncbi:MAG: triosephosphate isomerase [Spirochaetales bacterium]|nr:triosephosphate isomerase [Spirochaetales bacterium]
MKYLFLNLKRFDIPPEVGGVNRLAPPREWGGFIANTLKEGLEQQPGLKGEFSLAAFFPEAHIIGAVNALFSKESPSFGGGLSKRNELPDGNLLEVGCQSVHYEDTAPKGNFGAFTSFRPAHAMRHLGCTWTIIGHSEERRSMLNLMMLAGAKPEAAEHAVSLLLNMQIRAAIRAGLRVLFCIGERYEQVSERISVLCRQIEEGLAEVDMSRIVLAYEPIWAIGPGKTPPAADEIAGIAADIKRITSCPLVYGGGLKKDNAASIGSISELDGGLIALTRFEGEIGFYPEEFFEIIDAYRKGHKNLTSTKEEQRL